MRAVMAKPLYQTGINCRPEQRTLEVLPGRTPSWGGSAPEGAAGGNSPLHERESCCVLPEVVWMSQESAEVYEPGEREVCISIRDPAAPLPGLSPRSSPCSPWSSRTIQNRGRRTAVAASRRCRRIRASSVERHVAARRTVAHCLVGVSRSLSLAAGLLVAHGRWAEPDRIVNPWVYQRIPRVSPPIGRAASGRGRSTRCRAPRRSQGSQGSQLETRAACGAPRCKKEDGPLPRRGTRSVPTRKAYGWIEAVIAR